MRSVFAEPIIGLFGKHEKATSDYLEFRAGIEAMAARWAAMRATEADREILDSIMNKMETGTHAGRSGRRSAARRGTAHRG
jgi:GntR family transcriptional repressor for pyruvate dehydrogenase complex